MFYIDQRWQNDDFNNNLDVLYIDKVHILFFEKKVHILFFFEGIAMIAMNWRDSNDCPSIHCNHCYPFKKKKSICTFFQKKNICTLFICNSFKSFQFSKQWDHAEDSNEHFYSVSKKWTKFESIQNIIYP